MIAWLASVGVRAFPPQTLRRGEILCVATGTAAEGIHPRFRTLICSGRGLKTEARPWLEGCRDGLEHPSFAGPIKVAPVLIVAPDSNSREQHLARNHAAKPDNRGYS